MPHIEAYPRISPRWHRGTAGRPEAPRWYGAIALKEIAALAASLAAAGLGYPGVARLIRDEQLSPQSIVRVFAYGLARDCGRTCARVLLAGAIARRHACPDGWSGELERGLAEHALRPRHISLWNGGRRRGGVIAWDKISQEAAAIVGRHWGEIAAA